MVTRILSSLPLGYLADKFGVRSIVLSGAALSALALLLTSTFRSLWELYLYYGFLFSLGTSSAYVPITSNISKWFRKKRGLAVGIVVMGLGLGNIIVSPLTGFLIFSYGWRQAYVILGVLIFVTLAGAGLLLKEMPEHTALEEPRQSSNGPSKYLPEKSYTLRLAVGTKAFWMQGTSWFFLSVALYSMLVHFVPYAISIGIHPVRASAILGIMGGFSLTGRVVMGLISDRLGRRESVFFASLLSAFSVLGILLFEDLNLFYLSCSAFGFSYGGWGAQMPAMTADHFGQKNSGAILGGIFVVGGAGMAVGPWLTACLVDVTGSYLFLFLTAAVTSVLGSVSSLLIKPPFIPSDSGFGTGGKVSHLHSY
jgi:MFS family permease